jgi:hypothetical protein
MENQAGQDNFEPDKQGQPEEGKSNRPKWPSTAGQDNAQPGQGQEQLDEGKSNRPKWPSTAGQPAAEVPADSPWGFDQVMQKWQADLQIPEAAQEDYGFELYE